MNAQSKSPAYDILFTGARLIDGTGGPSRKADLAVGGDRIARIDA